MGSWRQISVSNKDEGKSSDKRISIFTLRGVSLFTQVEGSQIKVIKEIVFQKFTLNINKMKVEKRTIEFQEL